MSEGGTSRSVAPRSHAKNLRPASRSAYLASMATKKTQTASNSESKTTKRKTATRRKSAGATAKRSAKKAGANGKRAKAAAKPAVAAVTVAAAPLVDQQRDKHIAVAAYFLAEQRAFAPNHELDDWLAAEQNV